MSIKIIHYSRSKIKNYCRSKILNLDKAGFRLLVHFASHTYENDKRTDVKGEVSDTVTSYIALGYKINEVIYYAYHNYFANIPYIFIWYK